MYTQKINYGMTEEYFGLSTDTKPAKADNGDLLTEIDTGKKFRFDEENGTWHEQPSGGSGGGSGGSNNFIVTITETSDDQGGISRECDKTFDEILTAWNSHKTIWCGFVSEYDGQTYPITYSVASVSENTNGPAGSAGNITLSPWGYSNGGGPGTRTYNIITWIIWFDNDGNISFVESLNASATGFIFT